MGRLLFLNSHPCNKGESLKERRPNNKMLVMSKKGLADIALLNGKIITVNPDNAIAEAVAVSEGRIMGVGSNKEIKGMVGDETEVIDLKGKTVMPGIIDAHFHLESLATVMAYHVDIHVPIVKSVKDILDKITERIKVTPKGHWIVARGNFWLDQKIVDKRFPTKSELDKVAPDHPVVLLAAAHMLIVNSLALRLAGITRDTPQPSFGRIDKDPSTGEPTGILKELGPMLHIPAYTYEQKKEALKKCIKTMLTAQGITTIYDMPSDTDAVKIYQELLANNELPLRIGLYIIAGPGRDIVAPRMVDLDCILKLGLNSGFGNEWLKLAGIKLFEDGEWESGCSAMNEPYTLETFPSQAQNFGCIGMSQEVLNEMVYEAHKAGLQVCIHATGDRAIDMFITAVEAAQKQMPKKDHRHRIEHAGILQLSKQQITRMKKSGIIPSPQPQFLHTTGDFMEILFGKERTKNIFQFKTLLEEGFKLPGSSDSTGTQPEAVNPFWGIWCAVARKTFFGKVLCPEEKVNIMDAIRMFTINSAYAGFEENIKGSIEMGKLGDLIVLSDDPLKVPVDKIKDIKVDMTLVGGKIVHRR